jgi:hypothetical protein
MQGAEADGDGTGCWLGVPLGVVGGAVDGGGVDGPSLGVPELAGVVAGVVAGLVLGGALPLGWREGVGFVVLPGGAVLLDGPADGATMPPDGPAAGLETLTVLCDG